ncbi:serine/threonine-protein kinase [Phytomonospora sp. NPDC050363]|uniref:serine/threonine-protein kinase n=1 Tax=Phytomonospora sp. NPDC050363 TaxID=3155642 RepID=UPI0033FA52FA
MKPLQDSDPRTVGRYRVLAEIGEGGMGRVLLGAAPDGKLVALKLIRPQFVADEGFRTRFRHEVDASRQVAGPYTAAVVDADADAPTPWLASEFVRGPSLEQAVAASGPLPEDQALRLAAGLAAALTEVHRAGIVHRDLKPSNVILSPDGPKVIDFGVARAADGDGRSALTHTGWVVGSPSFMSPEHAGEQPVSAASDIFSLGCVLYLACTGRAPFEGATPMQVLYQVVNGHPDFSAIAPTVRAIVERCLAKDPAARPTPDEIQRAVGMVAPSGQPWTPPVQHMIGEQNAAIGYFASWSPGGPPAAPTVQEYALADESARLDQMAHYETAPAWQYAPPPPSITPMGGWPAPSGPPFLAPPPPKSTTARDMSIVGGAFVLVLLIVIAVVIAVSGDGDSGTLDTAGETPTDYWDDPATEDTETPTTEPTPTFDPTDLDDVSTDDTPITSTALLPDSFTDSEEVLYTLRSAGEVGCEQDSHTADIQDILDDYGCDEMVVGSYVDHTDQILVSVMVMPLDDAAGAEDAYDRAVDTYTQDWGIWCPADPEPGHEICDEDQYWSDAEMAGYMSQSHRYLIHSTALYINLSEDGSITEWVTAAADEAASAAGPQNYYDDW